MFWLGVILFFVLLGSYPAVFGPIFVLLFAFWVYSFFDSPSGGSYGGYSSGKSRRSSSSGSGESQSQEDVVPFNRGATSERDNGRINNRDEDLKLTGITIKDTDFLGREYWQHMDAQYRKKGTSRKKTDMMGNEYLQHYDEDSRRAGTSKVETDMMNNVVVCHYDEDGRKIAESRPRTDWAGIIEYTEHTEV